MAPHPLLSRIPPASDDQFVEHVARTGRRLTPRAALAFWRGRKTHLANVLGGAGLEPDEIANELEAFRQAVREEAARQRAAVAARQGPAAAGMLPAFPEKAEPRHGISSGDCEGVSHD